MLDLPSIHGPTGMALLSGIVVAVMVGLAGLLSVRWSRGKPASFLEEEGKTPDPFVFGSRKEKRRHYRRKGNESQILIKVDEQTFLGCVVDRSVGGMGLETDRELGQGLIFLIRPANATEIFPWIRVEVCTCRQISDGWLLGVRYLDNPPYGTLLAFG